MTKKVNFQLVYDLPDTLRWYAVNRNGALVGFKNPPIRNYQYGEWMDSVDGSTGELILYDKWDITIKEFDKVKVMAVPGKSDIKQRENTETYKKRRLLRG